MALKLSKDFKEENVLTEELADFDKALGKVLFLSAEPQMVFEEYTDATEGDSQGEIKFRPTDQVSHYEVNVYSEGRGSQEVVKMPAETSFDGLNYEDEVKLTGRSVFFWEDKQLVPAGNNTFRPQSYTGHKWRAEGIEKVGKGQSQNNKTAESDKSKESTK